MPTGAASEGTPRLTGLAFPVGGVLKPAFRVGMFQIARYECWTPTITQVKRRRHAHLGSCAAHGRTFPERHFLPLLRAGWALRGLMATPDVLARFQ